MSQTSLPTWQRNLVLGTQRFIYWFSKHWLALANLFVFLFLGIPFAAPVFMKLGLTGPAQLIYTIYKPLCHQLSFRSWFLFGEQPVYPLHTFEAQFGLQGASWTTVFPVARAFIGNETLGYKVAFCQRDIAIYGGLLLAGLAYAFLRRRGLRPMPFWLFIMGGVLPMALDGGSQFVSLALPWFPARESVWQLRTLTGALFGFSIAWLAYPHIQEGMEETGQLLAARYGWDESSEEHKPDEQQRKREEVIQLLKDRDVL